jgi:hypothetical protein
MKLLMVAILLAAVFATDAMASAQGALIKKKAKDLSNQNSVNQGVTPPTPARPTAPSAPATVPASPNAPKISASRQQNINQLLADLKAIKSKSVTPEQKQQLKKDLLAAAEGAKKPSSDSVTKLANNLSAVWADQKLSPQEQTFLATDLNTVLNSANMSAAESQGVLNRAQTILKYSGISKDDGQKIVNDLKAIAAELQKK